MAKKRRKEISDEELLATIDYFLENPLWLDNLEPKKSYIRLHDDHDGEKIGRICVTFSQDGDAWIENEPSHTGSPLRFRSEFGGGQSKHVRAALIILAAAINKDNKHRPQK